MSDPAARSIDAWPTFAFACRTFARHALPLIAAFGMFILPEVGLFAIAAPNLAGSLLGSTPTDVPPGEFLAFAGVLLLVIMTGALSTIVAADLADHALGGHAPPGLGEAFGRALGPLPAVLGAYALLVAVVLLPMIPLFVLYALAVGTAGGEPPIAAALGLALGVLVVVPLVVAAGMYLRLGPIRAAIRDEGPIAATRAGLALVRGRFWRSLGYLGLVSLTVQLAMSGLMIVSILLHTLQATWGFLVYGLALSACIAFQVVHDVALMRRLEDANTPPPGAPDDGLDDVPDDVPIGA